MQITGEVNNDKSVQKYLISIKGISMAMKIYRVYSGDVNASSCVIDGGEI